MGERMNRISAFSPVMSRSDVGRMLVAVMDVITSPSRGASAVGMALYQVMFEKLTEPALTRFGMMLNEVGFAFITNPTRKCSNSCKNTPGTIARTNTALSPIFLATRDQIAVAVAAYREHFSHV